MTLLTMDDDKVLFHCSPLKARPSSSIGRHPFLSLQSPNGIAAPRNNNNDANADWILMPRRDSSDGMETEQAPLPLGNIYDPPQSFASSNMAPSWISPRDTQQQRSEYNHSLQQQQQMYSSDHQGETSPHVGMTPKPHSVAPVQSNGSTIADFKDASYSQTNKNDEVPIMQHLLPFTSSQGRNIPPPGISFYGSVLPPTSLFTPTNQTTNTGSTNSSTGSKKNRLAAATVLSSLNPHPAPKPTRQRRNALARASLAKKRNHILTIQNTPVEKRTAQQSRELQEYETKRKKKCEKAKQKDQEHKAEMERVLEKPENKWSKKEKKFVEKQMAAKLKKNQRDRVRRQRLKAQKEAEQQAKMERIRSTPQELRTEEDSKFMEKVERAVVRKRREQELAQMKALEGLTALFQDDGN